MDWCTAAQEANATVTAALHCLSTRAAANHFPSLGVTNVEEGVLTLGERGRRCWCAGRRQLHEEVTQGMQQLGAIRDELRTGINPFQMAYRPGCARFRPLPSSRDAARG